MFGGASQQKHAKQQPGSKRQLLHHWAVHDTANIHLRGKQSALVSGHIARNFGCACHEACSWHLFNDRLQSSLASHQGRERLQRRL